MSEQVLYIIQSTEIFPHQHWAKSIKLEARSPKFKPWSHHLVAPEQFY